MLLHSELHAGPELAFSQARHRGTTACSATAELPRNTLFMLKECRERDGRDYRSWFWNQAPNLDPDVSVGSVHRCMPREVEAEEEVQEEVCE